MATQTKILVPIDFSAESKVALEFATALARDGDRHLLIVHVVEPELEYLGGVKPLEAIEGLDHALHDVKPRDNSVSYSHRMLDGLPADAILKAAKDEQVEMIVMGTHGRSGLKRLVMGSVAESVLRAADCPVLTVRQPRNVDIPVAASQ